MGESEGERGATVWFRISARDRVGVRVKLWLWFELGLSIRVRARVKFSFRLAVRGG